MKQYNSRYQSATGAIQQIPRITIQLYFSESDSIYLTSHSDGLGRPSGGGVVAVDGCIDDFRGGTQRINPKNSTSSIGSISFSCVDINGELSTILADKNDNGKSPRNQKVKVYYGFDAVLGFDAVDWLDYEQQFTMIIRDYRVSPGMITFDASDIQRLELTELFVADKTTLRETITAEQTKIPISENATTTKFELLEHDASYTDRPSAEVGYIKIKNEIICHNGIVDDPTYGVSFNVLERGALNTLAVGHKVDQAASDDRKTAIEEYVYLEGPALKLLYALQTGELYGQSGKTLPTKWHHGIDTSYIRLSDYQNADPLLWDVIENTGRKLRFEGLKKTNGKTFIEREILSWCVGFRPVYADGTIGFKVLSSVLSNADYVYELNNFNISQLGDLHQDYSSVVNDISIQWDYSPQTDQYKQQIQVIDPNSKSKYQDGEPIDLAFKGVKSTNQTDRDIRNIFDNYRNRYAGGGLTLSVEVMPYVNHLEVGDNVRVKTANLIDPLTNAALDRVFEVQQLAPNFTTGKTRLALFASTDAAGEFEVITAQSVLDDDFYTTQAAAEGGTNITSLTGYSNGALTQSITINGGNTISEGIYYHDGNLTINSGVTITITGNVQFRVKGVFTRNGDINGKGGGHPGGSGGTQFESGGTSLSINNYQLDKGKFRAPPAAWETNEGAGVPGYMGNSRATNRAIIVDTNEGETFEHETSAFIRPTGDVAVGKNSGADRLNLVNRDGLTIPKVSDSSNIESHDLRGTGGPGGAPLLLADYTGSAPYTLDIVQNGAAGGDGGAGLMIICRGEAVGVSSDLDLSGEDGASNSNYTLRNGELINHGGGGGGQPGAYYLLIDGNGSFGSGVENITQDRGLSGIGTGTTQYEASVLPDGGNGFLFSSDPLSPFYRPPDNYSYWVADDVAGPTHFGRAFDPVVNMGALGFEVQFVPVEEGVEPVIFDEPDYQLAVISGVSLTSGAGTLLPAKDGGVRERIKVTWNAATEAQATGYEIQAQVVGSGEWRTVAAIDDVNEPRAFFDVESGIDYKARVRVIGGAGTEASDWVESGNHTATGKSATPTTPSGLTVNVQQDSGVVIKLDAHPDNDFLEYVVLVGATYGGATEIFRGAATQFLWDTATAASYTVWVDAYNRSGVKSATASQAITISAPAQPSASQAYEGPNVVIDFESTAGDFVISHYLVKIGASVVSTQKSTQFTKKVDWAGARTYTIVSVDIAGNESAGRDIVVNPTVPGTTNVFTTVIDNYIEFRYNGVVGSLPISHYEMWKGSTFAGAEKFEDKSGSSSFTVKFEPTSGVFVYWFRAVDTAGNLGSESSVTATVSQPPDFIFYNSFSEKALGWDGTKTNAIVTTAENLLVLVDSTETWNEYTSNGNTTFQQEIDSGYALYVEPGTTTASYEKTYDLGVEVGYSLISVSVSPDVLEGVVDSEVTISYSDDNVTFTDVVSRQAFGVNFRYVKLKVDFTSDGGSDDIARVQDIQCVINLKEQGESGRVSVSSGDSGGTVVSFTKNFIDVSSITVTPLSTTARIATYDFVDAPNPTNFKILLYDTNGTRVSGDVSYLVRGHLSSS